MDARITRSLSYKNVSGFTLIELMIAMVLGLIVIGAVLALSLSMIRANSGTISSTRLTQELRATSAVIASELQRAGSAENPFNLTAAGALGAVALANNDTCIRYTYSQDGATVQRAIYWSGDSVYLGVAACDGGTKLSSSQVSITNLKFTRAGRAITVTLKGALPGSNTVYRQYLNQTVFAPGLSST